jgi:hypothetical protein
VKNCHKILAFCVILLVSNVYGDEFDHQVITMFGQGVVELPGGADSSPVKDASFEPEEIKDILLEYTATTISKAFPDFDLADTLVESPRFPGLFARQARLDLIYRITLENETLRDTLNLQLENFNEIKFSHKNGGITDDHIPNDPEFGLQWGMNNENDIDIDAPEAWDISTGIAPTVMGIIDRGVDLQHVEFQGRVNGEPPLGNHHGTHVAGIAAAEGDNWEGVAGVAWNAEIYSKRMGNDDITLYNAIYDAVVNQYADVLNCSWGDDDFHHTPHLALTLAQDMGVLIVASRGNTGDDSYHWPATTGKKIMSVGSINILGFKSEFSCYGRGIDVMAPGSYIRSTIIGGYGYMSGTSMAAPHVTGLVGLLESQNNLVSFGSNFENIIKNTAVDMYSPGYDDLSGHGLINAEAALEYIGLPKEIFTCNTFDFEPDLVQTIYSFPFNLKGSRHLSPGNYMADRYEVHFTVPYSACDEIIQHSSNFVQFDETPEVWAIDCMSQGWSDENPNYGVWSGEVVSADEQGVVLSTYCYYIWELLGPVHGWFPNHWENAEVYFTVIADMTPKPPVNLSVTLSEDYHPLIQWQPGPSGGSNDVVGYSIYRKVETVDDDFVHVTDVPATTLEYEDLEYSYPPEPSSTPSQPPPTPLSLQSNPPTIPTPLVIRNAHYTVTAFDYRHIESEMPTPVTIEVDVPCEYVVGDVNGSGLFNGADITYGVNYFQGGPPPVYECECTEEDVWYKLFVQRLRYYLRSRLLKRRPRSYAMPRLPSGWFWYSF